MLKIGIGVISALGVIATASFFLSTLLHSTSVRDVAFYTHLISLSFTVLGVLFADHLGFDWLRGKKQLLDAEVLARTHRWVGVGLGLMLGSGSVLFWNAHTYLLTTAPFYIKMSFVLALIINSFVIETYMRTATERPFASLTRKEKLPLLISGAISTVCWLGAATTAFFLLD